MQLKNETVVNVAQLMKEDTGAARKYHLDLDWFALDEDLMARDVVADLRLTRISRGILASGRVNGTALVECVRCLEIYEQPFSSDFDQEYHPLIDVRSGLLLDQPSPDEELGVINELHELDLAEPMRQVAILDLPIKPVCDDACEGLAPAQGEEDELGDRRLAALQDLLEDDTDQDSSTRHDT